MYIDESFRYRGLSMNELDEMIYTHKMAKGRTIDLTGTVLLTKPGLSTTELAGQVLDIAQKALVRELQEAIFIDGDPGTCFARSVLEDIIRLCEAQLTESESK